MSMAFEALAQASARRARCGDPHSMWTLTNLTRPLPAPTRRWRLLINVQSRTWLQALRRMRNLGCSNWS